MISKKKHAWRTLLVIPGQVFSFLFCLTFVELDQEIKNAKKNEEAYRKLITLEQIKEQAFNRISPDTPNMPDLSGLKELRSQTCQEIGESSNPYFGSLFRNGFNQTFFSMQVGRYADLYTSSVLSLNNYNMAHRFVPQVMLLPHERLDLNLVQTETPAEPDFPQ
jgi:5'-nucleotidase